MEFSKYVNRINLGYEPYRELLNKGLSSSFEDIEAFKIFFPNIKTGNAKDLINKQEALFRKIRREAKKLDFFEFSLAISGARKDLNSRIRLKVLSPLNLRVISLRIKFCLAAPRRFLWKWITFGNPNLKSLELYVFNPSSDKIECCIPSEARGLLNIVDFDVKQVSFIEAATLFLNQPKGTLETLKFSVYNFSIESQADITSVNKLILGFCQNNAIETPWLPLAGMKRHWQLNSEDPFVKRF